MKKFMLICTSLILAASVNLIGCSTDCLAYTPSSITGTASTSLPFRINSVAKPVSSDKSSAYATYEITALRKHFAASQISCIYFLDNNTIIFSANDRKISDDSNEDNSYDLFKYDLKTAKLTHICSKFMLSDSTVTVINKDNFFIVKSCCYLKVKNGKKVILRNLRAESKKHFSSADDIFYNETADKLLITCGAWKGKEHISEAYVANNNFTSPKKLPFSGIYRAQWIDSTHVLVGYKSGDKSKLAKYSIKDKTSVITTLPKRNFFIDPVICDNGLIMFTYLETQGIEYAPFGFLNSKTNTISRISFASANSVSMLRNGRMAAFTDINLKNIGKSKFYLYDTANNKSTVRGTAPGYPDCVAVSPDGATIVFVSYTTAKNVTNYKFYINRKK